MAKRIFSSSPFVKGSTSPFVRHQRGASAGFLPMSTRTNITESASSPVWRFRNYAPQRNKTYSKSSTNTVTGFFSTIGEAFSQWNTQREQTAQQNIAKLKSYGKDVLGNWGYYLWGIPTVVTNPAVLPSVLQSRAAFNTVKDISQGFSSAQNIPEGYDWSTYDWGQQIGQLPETAYQYVVDTGQAAGQAAAAPFQSLGEDINEGLNKLMLFGLIGVLALVVLMKNK